MNIKGKKGSYHPSQKKKNNFSKNGIKNARVRHHFFLGDNWQPTAPLRGRQRMRRLDGITKSTVMSLSKLRERLKDSKACCGSRGHRVGHS